MEISKSRIQKLKLEMGYCKKMKSSVFSNPASAALTDNHQDSPPGSPIPLNFWKPGPVSKFIKFGTGLHYNGYISTDLSNDNS